MKSVIILICCLFGLMGFSQEKQTEWYILEKGCSVGVIKPGVNDLTYFLAASGNKPVNQEAVNGMIKKIVFRPGYLVLIHAVADSMYIATDMEGRNLVVKGKVSKAERGQGCTVGYMKETLTIDNTVLRNGEFVWIKEHLPGNTNVTVQFAGNKNLTVPIAKVFDINETTLEMANTAKMKKVE